MRAYFLKFLLLFFSLSAMAADIVMQEIWEQNVDDSGQSLIPSADLIRVYDPHKKLPSLGLFSKTKDGQSFLYLEDFHISNHRLWEIKLSESYVSTNIQASEDDRFVLVNKSQGGRNWIEVFEVTTGKSIWKTDLAWADAYPDITLLGSEIILRVSKETAQVLDFASGKVLDSIQTLPYSFKSIAKTQDGTYVVTYNKQLFIDASKSGKRLWTKELKIHGTESYKRNSGLGTVMEIQPGVLLVTFDIPYGTNTTPSRLMQVTDGKSIGQMPAAQQVVYDSTHLFLGQCGSLEAFDRTTLKWLWGHYDTSNCYMALSKSGDTILTTPRMIDFPAGKVEALDASTGTLLATQSVPAHCVSNASDGYGYWTDGQSYWSNDAYMKPISERSFQALALFSTHHMDSPAICTVNFIFTVQR